MRDNVKEFVRLVTTVVPIIEPVIEIGSFQVDEQVGYADLRSFFPGKEYIGCDMRWGPGVDRIENVEHLNFESGVVGSVLILDTLEHVQNPIVALWEIHRVLKPGGIVVMSSVMAWPIHDYPSDYWRFTPQSFEFLLERFETRLVYVQGQKAFPHAIFGLGRKAGGDPEVAEAMANKLSPMNREESGFTITTDGASVVAKSPTIVAGAAVIPILGTGIVTRSGKYYLFDRHLPARLLSGLRHRVLGT
jgi:SAM-dependent methyltransferase